MSGTSSATESGTALPEEERATDAVREGEGMAIVGVEATVDGPSFRLVEVHGMASESEFGIDLGVRASDRGWRVDRNLVEGEEGRVGRSETVVGRTLGLEIVPIVGLHLHRRNQAAQQHDS